MFDSRSLLGTKRRKRTAILMAIAMLLGVAIFLVWAGKSLTASRVDRWLPARAGDAVVLAKVKEDGAPMLMVRVEVPEASPEEAALLPADLAGREAMLPARAFEKSVPVTAEQWDTIEVGADVRAMYQINVRRADIFVAALYRDAMTPGTSQH